MAAKFALNSSLSLSVFVFIWIAPYALCIPGLMNPEESPELNADISKLARNKKMQDWSNCRQKTYGQL
jgi:hypothetical protein